jgi:hypothetical protein
MNCCGNHDHQAHKHESQQKQSELDALKEENSRLKSELKQLITKQA